MTHVVRTEPSINRIFGLRSINNVRSCEFQIYVKSDLQKSNEPTVIKMVVTFRSIGQRYALILPTYRGKPIIFRTVLVDLFEGNKVLKECFYQNLRLPFILNVAICW